MAGKISTLSDPAGVDMLKGSLGFIRPNHLHYISWQMKIEFLTDIHEAQHFHDDADDPGQLVRIYHFDAFQADKLR